ncbi:hypothetical protein, partial [Frankia sp. CcWB3]
MHALDLATLVLAKGGHDNLKQGSCLLEAVSYLADEPWSDRPECVSPVLGAFGRILNDVLPNSKRQKLKPYIPQLMGTAADGLDEARGCLALDWLVRVCTPTWLRLVPGPTAYADLLANHRPIASLEDVAAIGDIVRDAASHAAQARAAAREAAWPAVRDAAWDAAWVAACNAARAVQEAAWAAAQEAAAREAA